MKIELFNKYLKQDVATEGYQTADVEYDPTQNKFFTEGSPNSAEQTEETQALIVEDSPVDDLYNHMELVSMEAGYIGNIQNYFSRKADKISISVREGFRYLTTINYNPMEPLYPLQMSNIVSGLVFEEHEGLRVPQPVGFKGEMYPYTVGLVQRAQVMARVLEHVIKPAASRFGYYLSVDMERAERHTFEHASTMDASVETLIKEDAEFFANARSGSAKLGDLFTSFRDFIDSEQNMLEVQKLVSNGGTNEVKKAVESLSIVATALINRLGEDKYNKASNEFTKMMADQIKEVATWVEWYSIQMTRIIETNNVLSDIEKELKKL